MLRTILVTKLIDLSVDMVMQRLICAVCPNITLSVGMKFRRLYRTNGIWAYEYRNVKICNIEHECVSITCSDMTIWHYCKSYDDAVDFLRQVRVLTNCADVYVLASAVILHHHDRATTIDLDDMLRMIHDI